MEEQRDSRDFNNNKKEREKVTLEHIGLPELTHDKLRFSKDISPKEEALRNMNMSDSKQRKNVTFDRYPPMYLGCVSDSDEGILHRHLSLDSLSISSSGSDLSQPRFTIATMYQLESEDVLSKAETKLGEVLKQLENLWLDLRDDETTRKFPSISSGKKTLMQTISLIGLITEQLTTQYQSRLDPEKLSKLQSKNDLLEEELKNSKIKIQCLEAELNCYSKENILLNKEVQEMSYKLAVETGSCRKCDFDQGTTADNKNLETEVFYRNPYRQFQSTDSKSATDANLSRSVIYHPHSHYHNGNIYPETISDPTRFDNSKDEMHISRRENEMNCIIQDFNEKFRNTNTSLHAQFRIYDQQLENWKSMLNVTNEEKQQMFSDLVETINELKAVLKERDHYEFILKLILQEKSSDHVNIEMLLQRLLGKLNEQRNNDGSWVQTSLLEGAVQVLQEQNVAQREEIWSLKQKVGNLQSLTEEQFTDLEKLAAKIESMMEEMIVKDGSLQTIQDEAQKKYSKLQDMHNEVISAKTNLEKASSEKDDEIKALQDSLKMLKRSNKRLQTKLQHLQKSNSLLVKETKESKNNMDHLALIISQLRSGLRDQKTQWDERIKLCSEESAQNKEHYEWVKKQMEHLSQQLAHANERLQSHEMDKLQLAQQLLLAEEERRVVDRKLQELRTALQGDTGLREALIERNETLQMEINRLRQDKFSSFVNTIQPPMEMRGVNPQYHMLTENCLHISKKNAHMSTNRRCGDRDPPRAAISLHDGSGK